jgi:hypothetical protein
MKTDQGDVKRYGSISEIIKIHIGKSTFFAEISTGNSANQDSGGPLMDYHQWPREWTAMSFNRS